MQSNTDQARQHFWDGLRAFLMLLGIPYHVALCYQPGQDFIVHSGEGMPGFAQFAGVIHVFRMPAFFVVAGFFAMLLLAQRDPGAWLKGRLLRLGLPLVTCLVTLVPAMNLVCELSNLPWQQAVRSWRENSLTSGGYWVRHLWFIVVLLYFSTVVAWLAGRSPAVKRGFVSPRRDTWAARHFRLAMLGLGVIIGVWEALAVEAFYAAGLATMIPQQLLRLDETIMFLPWFALGCVLARAPETMRQTTRFSPLVALAAAVTLALWLVVHDQVAPMVERFLASLAALATAQVLIAAARSLLNRPIPWIRRITNASFVIYLFHLPLITLLVWLAQPLPVPILAKALAIMALSFGMSYAIWLMIGRIRTMSLLFGGVTVRPRGRMAAAA
jgi:glucan biosynthesis protein C